MAIKNEDVKKMCDAISDFIMLIVNDWAGGDSLNIYPIESILKVLNEYDERSKDSSISKSDLMSLKAKINSFNDMHIMIAKALKARDTLLGISKSASSPKKSTV